MHSSQSPHAQRPSRNQDLNFMNLFCPFSRQQSREMTDKWSFYLPLSAESQPPPPLTSQQRVKNVIAFFTLAACNHIQILDSQRMTEVERNPNPKAQEYEKLAIN